MASKKELVHGNLRIAFQTNYAPGQKRRYREMSGRAVVIQVPDGQQIGRMADSIKEVIEQLQILLSSAGNLSEDRLREIIDRYKNAVEREFEFVI